MATIMKVVNFIYMSLELFPILWRYSPAFNGIIVNIFENKINILDDAELILSKVKIVLWL